MELLSFVAMEPPVSFEASAVRAEKVKVWKAIQPIHPADTVRGQYGPGTVDGKQVLGYRQEDRVHPRSQTETYAALRLEIENWRWAGVPFYIRAGKRLGKARHRDYDPVQAAAAAALQGRQRQRRRGHQAKCAFHAHSAGRGNQPSVWRQGSRGRR